LDAIGRLEKAQLRNDLAKFNIGDTVKVYVKIKEGDKERIQPFEGTVISKSGGGLNETFTLRRVLYGEGVERVFPMHSPRIDRIAVQREGVARRAKLYYLRKKVGKKARVRAKKRS
jgi:large subunit ribosomal protein L19